MVCIKCKQEIPENSLYCNHCGKKQSATPAKYHKREHGTGTISKDSRNKKPWIAHGPSTRFGDSRVYIGSFATRAEAKKALDDFLAHGRPDLWNATLADVYDMWSETHFQQVSRSAVNLYSAMWKRFSDISLLPMRDIRTAHYQEIVNAAKSQSACHTIKVMATMMSRWAMENDIITKNYAEFIQIPKFEKKEKRIFTRDEIAALWASSDDKRVQAILLMIYTGFRIGEICALTVESVNLDTGYIIGGEKTNAGKNRLVPIPPSIPELKEFVRKWISETGSGRLFPMSTARFRDEVFYQGLEACGIDTSELTPHSTRHTFASLSSAAGLRPENLQKIIGHANFSTTAQVYIHQDIDTLLREMGKLKK
jgi:integrase